MTHLLISYIPLPDHHDPNLEEFTYGDLDARARKLKSDLKRGDYVFFHTTIRGRRCITAYYVIDRVCDTSEAVSNQAILAKYQNPHFRDYLEGRGRDQDNVVIFGDPILSRKLPRQLLFDRELAEKLSLNIPFSKGFTENQCISSATRQWRELTDEDVKVLLSEIGNIEEEGFNTDTILSTDEVLEIREVDLEDFIVKNSKLIEPGLTPMGRQVDTRQGRLDLLFEDKGGNIVVVELKSGEVGRGAINQLRRYLDQIKEDTKKQVRGVIICKGIRSTFVDEFRKLRDIQVLNFGWKLTIYPIKWD